jgi:predicted GNAT superfamily acetyltransferase
MQIRDAKPADFLQIIRLNDESEHYLDSLNTERLAIIHREAIYHRVLEVNGQVDAFLLAFSESADYAYPSYLWFVENFSEFIYIDRVVVSLSQQGHGLGKLLYNDLIAFADTNGSRFITCEFDIDPPNELSRNFHYKFGFNEVGTQLVGANKNVFPCSHFLFSLIADYTKFFSMASDHG